MKFSVIVPALLASLTQAWRPEDGDLAAFNMTARFEKLGKRFKPGLPSGINKIRGVNFGGKSRAKIRALSGATLTVRGVQAGL